MTDLVTRLRNGFVGFCTEQDLGVLIQYGELTDEAADEIEHLHDLLGKANALARIRWGEIERLNKEVAELTIPGEVRIDPEYFQKLRKIEEAAQNLLSVRGRHHTEQAYKQLEGALK